MASRAGGLCETPCVRRTLPVVAVVASSVTLVSTLAGFGTAATPSGWSGSASCTITVTGPGYQHTETQRWQVAGPASIRGSFRFVPSHWTDIGSGSSLATQGDQSRKITWTVKAAAPGKFQFVVRASDGKLLIAQANAQLRVPNGITGTQQLTIGGVDQKPGQVGLEAFETQLPPIVIAATARTVSGTMPSTRVAGSFGPFQPAAASTTKRCSWRFTRAATHR